MKCNFLNQHKIESYIFLLIILCPYLDKGQSITFNEHISPIIYQNCTPCHRPNEVGPFSLITYQDVSKRGTFIQKVTASRYMPPWRADHDFGEFKNVRKLTVGQIALIRLWVENGMPEGDKNDFEMPDFRAESQFLRKPDLTLSFNNTFPISNNLKEDYILFSMPTNLPVDTFIKEIEFIPGNKKLVHHARISVDTTQIMRIVDAKSIDDTLIREYGKIRMKEEYWSGWVPNNNSIKYPDGFAKKLKANCDLLLNLHYAPNVLKNETDSSIVNLYFSKEPIEKEVQTFVLQESDITNQPFEIAADTIITFYAKSTELPYPIYLLSVLPHQHFLGKSLRSFAITPGGDMIPLIKISNWDFNWQMTYEYKEPLLIPTGSIIFAEATYDNTKNNPENRFSPPQKITKGWNSTMEMMNIIFQYVK